MLAATGVTDGKQIEIVSGLNEGDKILIKTFSVGLLDTTGPGTNPFMPGGSRPAGVTGAGSGRH